jgi:hypothetical protein
MEIISGVEGLVLVTSGLIVRALPIINAQAVEGLSPDFFLHALVCRALPHDLAPFLDAPHIISVVNPHIIIDDRHVAKGVVYDATVPVGKRQCILVILQRVVGDIFLLGFIDLFPIVFDPGGPQAEPSRRVIWIGFRRVLEKLLGVSIIPLIVFNHALIELVLGDNFFDVPTP